MDLAELEAEKMKPTYNQLKSEVARLKKDEMRRRKDDRLWNGLRDKLITPLSPADIVALGESEKNLSAVLAQELRRK